MTIYTKVPGWVRLHYTTIINTVTIPHVMDLPIKPELWDGVDTVFDTVSGGSILFVTAVDELVNLLDAMYNTDSTFTIAELWRQDSSEVAPVLVATYNVDAIGTTGTAATFAGQAVFAFRCANGTLLKLYLMESDRGINSRQAYADIPVNPKALVDYLVGAGGWVQSRGNAWPVALTFLTTKTNDKLRKLRMGL